MAKGASTVQKVEEIVLPYAKELGLEIWNIVFKKEGSDWYLRIFIDKDGGVNINDCVDLTHAITKPIDEADPINQSYTLEVSSPGVERALTKDWHFKKYVGENVMLRLIRPKDGVKDFKGTLTAYDDGNITLKLQDDSELTVNKKETSFVKLDDFNMSDFE